MTERSQTSDALLSPEVRARRDAFVRPFPWAGTLAGLGWAAFAFGGSADWRDPVLAAACFGPLGTGAGLFVGHLLWAAGHEDDGTPVE